MSTMKEVVGSLDPTNTYYANIILKSGRNELQFYQVDGSFLEKSRTTTISRIELQSDEKICSFCWVVPNLSQENSTRRRSKRKAASDGPVSPSLDSTPNLVVSLENSDILFISPSRGTITQRFTYSNPLFGIVSGSDDGSIWGIANSTFVVQISIFNGEETRRYTLPNKQKVRSILPIEDAQSSAQKVAIGSKGLQVVEFGRSKKAKVIDFPQKNINKEFHSIIRSSSDPNIVAAIAEDSDVILIYDLNNPEVLTLLQASSSNIESAHFMKNSSSGDGYTLVACNITTDFFLFKLSGDQAIVSPTLKVKANAGSSLNVNIAFSDIIEKEDEFIGVWYDKFEPKFTNFVLEGNSKEVNVDINYEKKNNEIVEQKRNGIAVPQSIQIKNISVKELYEKLNSSLNSEDDQETLNICHSNDNEENIKDTVKMFSKVDDQCLLKLFDIISFHVSNNPSKNSSLAVWLKWILLIHGRFIAEFPNQNENLRRLSEGLSDGMKLMPRLLTLKGRLQLLQTQISIRKNETFSDDAAEDEEQVVEVNDIHQLSNNQSSAYDEVDAEAYSVSDIANDNLAGTSDNESMDEDE